MKIGNGSLIYQSLYSASQQQASKFADLNNKLNVINTLSPKQAAKLDSYAVEKHVDDYKSGNANLSTETAANISGQEDRIFERLANEDPTARIKFGAYLTALTYDQRARYVENLGEVADSTEKILKGVQTKA